MNTFRLALIGALVISLAALGISYMASLRKSQAEAQEPLWQENIEQLKELCRTKYRQSLRYTAYAHHAERDSLLAEAELFHALSHADAIHCANCRKAINSLGGEFSLPIVAPTNFFHVAVHVESALNDKLHTHYHQIQPCISRALADNNRYIARMLTWCDASDVKQILLLRNILAGEVKARLSFRVCPTCGDVTWAEVATRHCPQCMTDSVNFLIMSSHLSSAER